MACESLYTLSREVSLVEGTSSHLTLRTSDIKAAWPEAARLLQADGYFTYRLMRPQKPHTEQLCREHLSYIALNTLLASGATSDPPSNATGSPCQPGYRFELISSVADLREGAPPPPPPPPTRAPASTPVPRSLRSIQAVRLTLDADYGHTSQSTQISVD